MRDPERRDFLRLVMQEPETPEKPRAGIWKGLLAILKVTWALMAWTLACVLGIFAIGMAVEGLIQSAEWLIRLF